MVKKIALGIGLVVLLVIIGLKSKPTSVSKPKNLPSVLQSKFSLSLEEIQRIQKESEEKARLEKIEAEKKRQQEGRQKFIAAYGPCRNLPILMYHHINDQPPGLSVKTSIFSNQMDYLAQKGYNTVTLPDLVNNLQNDTPLPSKPIVLTFDDGYRDFYTNAYPILKAHNFKATLFTISQAVNGDAYVTWDQLAEMAASGLITIGDHTLSHRSLPQLSPEQQQDQIVSARNILEGQLGIKVNVFAYPYGNKTDLAEKILGENGFVAAVVTGHSLTCAKKPLELGRHRIGNSPLSAYGL